jgi:hypothetical protein
VADSTVEVVLAGLSVVGALAGVVIGNRLEVSGEDRRRRRSAYEDTIAVALEVCEQLELIEIELAGGPAAPPLRPGLDRDVYLPIARLGLSSSRPLPELGLLSDAIAAAVNPGIGPSGSRTFGVTAERRAAQRLAIMKAIEALRTAAVRDVEGNSWNRLWLRLRRR